jgi:hypothetical protein
MKSTVNEIAPDLYLGETGDDRHRGSSCRGARARCRVRAEAGLCCSSSERADAGMQAQTDPPLSAAGEVRRRNSRRCLQTPA